MKLRRSWDRRQQPAPVDWQARCLAAEKECERLKADNKNLAQTCITRVGEIAAATARAEDAEKECERLVNERYAEFDALHALHALEGDQSTPSASAPEPQAWPIRTGLKPWHFEVMRRIEALEGRQR